MKAISLWQPWASLVAVGAKRFETRSWSTYYRGEIAIHAATKRTRSVMDLVDTKPFCHHLTRGDLVFGAIVAVADLSNVFPAKPMAAELAGRADPTSIQSVEEYLEEMAFGDWTPGRFAWRLENVRPTLNPIWCGGRQRIWTLDADCEAAVRRNL